MTDFTAFQVIQYDFIVAPAIYYIRLKLYMNVLCCRHLQVALKHIVILFFFIYLFFFFFFADPDPAILGGERPQATNSIVNIRKYKGENTPRGPAELRSDVSA